jgi:ribonuclease P protein component
MLPRAERLTKSGLFQRTHASRKSINSAFVTLYVLERQPKSAPRLPLVGFVVGKKVHARAVQRNRAKRRVREAYRRVKQSMPPETASKYNLQQWYSLVWHIRPEAMTAPFQDLCQSIDQCLAAAAAKYGRKSIKARTDG